MSPDGVIIYDAAEVGDPPAGVNTLALTAGDLLPEQKAAEVAINAGASGALLGLLKVPLPPLMAMLLEAFEAKGAEVVGWNHKAAAAGLSIRARLRAMAIPWRGSPPRPSPGSCSAAMKPSPWGPWPRVCNLSAVIP